MIQYILECISFQLVFLVIYDLFLKRETFFQWNRFYLIGSYVLSMVLPWVKIEALKTEAPEVFHSYPEFLWSTNDVAITAIARDKTSFSISWEYALLFGGMLLATLFFGYKLHQIYALKRKGEVHCFKDFTQIIVSNSSIAFSFFKSIFLGDKVMEKEYQSIVQHELVHIRQRHSYDLMFFELMRIVGWFNPLVYVYQNRVSELHEFIADAQVAKTNKKGHYEFLLSQVFQTQNISFINQFFKTSLIKKRIVMLTKEKSRQVLKLKYVMLVPIVFGMLAYTSIEAQDGSDETGNYVSQSDDETLIAEAKERIEKEVNQFGSLRKVHLNHPNRSHFADSDGPMVSKEEYFESALLFRMLMQQTFEDMAEEKQTQAINYLNRIPLPSTARYESYISRKEAFQILDENLKFSIRSESENIGYDIRKIEEGKTYSGASYVFEVADVSDLTGKEITIFNNKMDEIFGDEDAINSSLVLKDKEYRFQIFATKPVIAINTYPKLSLDKAKNQDNNFGNQGLETMEVNDVDKMSKSEKKKLFFALRSLSKKGGYWQFQLKDDSSSIIYESSTNDSYIKFDGYDELIYATMSIQRPSKGKGTVIGIDANGTMIPFAKVDEVPIFPGCEDADDSRACFQQKMMRHISKNFNYPKEAQEKGLQGRVSVLFTINQKGLVQNLKLRGPDTLLENEAKRIILKLPQMVPGKHNGEVVGVMYSIPISFKLDMGKEDIEKKEVITSGIPFGTVDEVPVFPGCEDDENKGACFNKMMQKHISKNFNYPQEAQEKGIQGRVNIMFMIGKDGVIKNLRMRGPDRLLEDEARRIIMRLPDMKPGRHKGKNVDVPYSIPISFKLEAETKSPDILKFISNNNTDPIYFVDGKETSQEAINMLNPNNIESISVLKGEAGRNVYGEKGKNGVIQITLKKKY